MAKATSLSSWISNRRREERRRKRAPKISYTSDDSLENLKFVSGGKKQMVKKKKCRFDCSSSSSSSDDESFATRKLRIAQRKKKSAATKSKSMHNNKKKVNKSCIDLMDSDNDDGVDIGRRTKKYKYNKKPSCIELIDSDGDADRIDVNKKKKGKGYESTSSKDDVDRRTSRVTAELRNDRSTTTRSSSDQDREPLIQRSKHLVTKTGSVLSKYSSSDNAIYAGMDPASRALIQKLQQEDEAAKSTGKIMGENDRTLARRMHAAERAKSTNGRESISSMEDLLQSLDKCQRDALVTVERQARIRHEAAYPKVQQRITMSLGYKHQDLDNCLAYIRNEAPIIIHLNEQCLSFLAGPGETHYRNLFEVNTSGGNRSHELRYQWEWRMFGSTYDKATYNGNGVIRATPFQRVKYGCLNFTGDIEGVAPARRYGQFFITLKRSVRHRCTFFNMDSSDFGRHDGSSYGGAFSDTLATAKYYCHILEKYSDAELHSILALNKIGGGQSKCINYKEVQIHGPVCLATNIEALSIPGREVDASRDLMSTVERFQKKSNCTILWQADLLGHDSSRRHRMDVGMHPHPMPYGTSTPAATYTIGTTSGGSSYGGYATTTPSTFVGGGAYTGAHLGYGGFSGPSAAPTLHHGGSSGHALATGPSSSVGFGSSSAGYYTVGCLTTTPSGFGSHPTPYGASAAHAFGSTMPVTYATPPVPAYGPAFGSSGYSYPVGPPYASGSTGHAFGSGPSYSSHTFGSSGHTYDRGGGFAHPTSSTYDERGHGGYHHARSGGGYGGGYHYKGSHPSGY